MWSGHSCPLPLTLPLQLRSPLILKFCFRCESQQQLQDQKRRTGVSAPHRMLLFFFFEKGDAFMFEDLKGRTAVVFGVANKRSIAWAIAQGLHAAGVNLAITYQNERMEM